jgi:hypothetical protein
VPATLAVDMRIAARAELTADLAALLPVRQAILFDHRYAEAAR